MNKRTSQDISPVVINGTLSYIDAGGTQDIVEVVNTVNNIIRVVGITIDCTTLTQDGVLGLMVKVDGINYREVRTQAFTVATIDSICMIVQQYSNNSFKFTWTEGADEGAVRALPYEMSYEYIG